MNCLKIQILSVATIFSDLKIRIKNIHFESPDLINFVSKSTGFFNYKPSLHMGHPQKAFLSELHSLSSFWFSHVTHKRENNTTRGVCFCNEVNLILISRRRQIKLNKTFSRMQQQHERAAPKEKEKRCLWWLLISAWGARVVGVSRFRNNESPPLDK